MNIPTIEKKTLPGAMIEITGAIASADFLAYEEEAVKHFTEHAEIDGFRKGTAPKAMIVKTYGDMAILEEMAHRALTDTYPRILERDNIDAIGRPEITITKIARGEDLGFKIKTAIVPEITLPDYKKIAGGIEKKEAKPVTDEDVDKTIDEIRRMRAHEDMHIKMKAEGKDGHDHPEVTDETLPVLDDAFAKTVGPFETVDDLKKMVRENMVRESEMGLRDQFRVELFDALLEKATVEVPAILTEIELDKMMARLRSDLERSGLTLQNYLKELKKEETDIRAEWKVDAEKRAKMVLTMDAIWKAEKMSYDETVVENEVKNLMSLYPDADPLNLTEYIRDMMRNQQVFKFLEELK